MATTEQDIDARPRIEGLTEAEAAERRKRGLNNAAPVTPSRSYSRIFVQNAFTPINLTLFGICIGLAALRLVGDSAMTASLVIANVVVGVFQEVRAKRKLDRISLLTRPAATVIREGKEREVDPEEIVVDDVLVLKTGDQVLVDGRLLSADGVTVDESLLTGESDLVAKHAGEEVQSGTYCMSGSGTYRAEKVGADSLVQKLTSQARKFRNNQTPLQREVGLVLRVMAVVVAALSVQVFTAYRGESHGMSVSDSLRAAAVLVGLVPQGLSFMVTTTYALAVIRMAGSGALIQRINAVESISNVDLLCLDKTGTLTTNNLAVEQVLPLQGDEASVTALLGDYCASARSGNHTTEAIAEAFPGNQRPVLSEVAFSSARKWSALQFEDGVYVMGAPEMLAPALRPGTSLGMDWQEMASRGLRVLLFASAPGGTISEGDPRLPAGLTPIAIVSLSDQLRPEARSTIAEFAKAGIGIKIISGDSPDTVAALAVQAGFAPDLRSVSGLELDALSDAELRQVAEDSTVFGRITPEQKRRLIRVLRRRGRHTAMIGDGVNDVLALKQADLAIAMRSGSQVTRNVADIVLLDDSFATLPKAFVEGQRVRRGMLDIIRLFMVRTLSVALVILACTLVGAEFPTTPRQNGALAFLTVGIPTVALAAWARPAHTPKRLVLSSAHFVVPAAISIAVTTFCVYQVALWTSDLETARTALTITAILCGVTLILFAQPPVRLFVGGAELNGDWRTIFLALAMVALYPVILAVEPFRKFYEQRVLAAPAYILIVVVVITWAWALRKFWRWNLPGQTRRLWRFLTAEL
ncbi:MAG TPA: HAD-IC family P-type ATPase [Dehalococcoidia bacterium]|jgi:cation-transporting ATPase E|nr:HAD-IC family P-type ATPase [Dehalococcoidia bacterium]